MQTDTVVGRPIPRGWEGWRFAVAMYALALAGCTFLSFGLGYFVGEPGGWSMSGDVWWTTQSAQYVAWGGLGSVYAANPWFAALPGFLILFAPVAAYGSHLGLISGAPFPVATPSLWLLVGPFFFLVGSTAVLAVDYLCFTLGVSRPRRRVLGVGVALLVVSPTPGLAGHPEDLLALALSCLAVAYLIQGRTVRAAWVLGAAILVQTWAVLLIPLLVVATAPGERIRSFVRAAILPGVTALLVLVADFHDAFLDLFRQPMPNDGQTLPWMSLAGHLTVQYNRHNIVMVAGSTTRSLAVVAAVLFAVAIRKNPNPRNIMLVAGLALFARDFFEVEYWPYYLAPAAVVLAVTAAVTTPGRTKRFAVAAIAAFAMYGSAPMSYQGVGYNPYLALCILVVALAMVLCAALGPFNPDKAYERVRSWASPQVPLDRLTRLTGTGSEGELPAFASVVLPAGGPAAPDHP